MEEKQQKNQGSQISIELSKEIARGIYSNLAIISHSNSEFILDFVQVLPGTTKAEVRSRIILTPQHAKRLLYALKENIEKFEQQHGSIPVKEKEIQIPPNFGGPQGYA